MKSFGLSLDGEINNTRASQSHHAWVGALFGLAAGAAFAVAASGVDSRSIFFLPTG